MKKIIFQLLLLASLAGVWMARAQTGAGQLVDNTNTDAATAPGKTTVPTVTTDPATNAAPAEPAPPAATNAVPAEPAVPTATNAAPMAPAGATPAVDTNAAPASAVNPNGLTPLSQTIPLIQFSDVPITVAIEHLARQAGINYMLDPKIGYGQADQNGQLKNEPTLSIRWENITAENALVALLDNFGLQIVMDKRTGIDRITSKDPTALPTLVTRVVQLQYASASNMVLASQSVLTDKRSKVMADVRTSQMLVVATDPEQTAVDTLILELDKPTRQVLIETKLIEISSTPSSKRGVDWTSTLSSQNVTFGNGNISGNNAISTPGATTTRRSPPLAAATRPPLPKPRNPAWPAR